MNLNPKKQIKLWAAIAVSAALAACQKDTKSNQLKQQSLANDSAQTKKLEVLARPCGQAAVPGPGTGSLALRAGTILSCLAPNGQLPAGLPDQSVNSNASPRQAPPADIYFGPISSSSHRGIYHLVMQSDGNLVLYKEGASKSLWSTLSDTKGANKLITNFVVLQSDGNLVIKDIDKNGNLEQHWASNSLLCPGFANPILVLQGDGNIVELYPVTPVGGNTHGVIADTGTDGGRVTSDNGKFQ